MSDESKWAAICSAIGVLIAALVAGYTKVSGLWHTQRKETREENSRERREVVDQLRELLEESRHEVHELRNQLAIKGQELMVCQVERTRAEERIAAYEQVMENHGIKFRPWHPDDSSTSMDVTE